MQARNLLEEDCKKLEGAMEEIAKTNPEATHSFFREPFPDVSSEIDPDQLTRVEDKIDALHNKLDRIFGPSVLIDGGWVTL